MLEGFYVVEGWMVEKLNIKGNEIPVFAIIYGFSHNEECAYTGSLKYL